MKTKEELEQFLKSDVRGILGNLAKEHQPIWGRMDAQQMLEHLVLSMRLSHGKIKAPLATPEDKVEVFKRIGLLSDRPFQANIQNPALSAEPLQYLCPGFDEADNMLWDEVNIFFNHYKINGGEHKEMHNVFGPLNYSEWLWFHYKHFMHHAAQFSLVERQDKL